MQFVLFCVVVTLSFKLSSKASKESSAPPTTEGGNVKDWALDAEEFQALNSIVRAIISGKTGKLSEKNKEAADHLMDKFANMLEGLEHEPALDYYYMCRMANEVFTERCDSGATIPARIWEKTKVTDLGEAWNAKAYETVLGASYWRDLNITILSGNPLIVQTDSLLPSTLIDQLMHDVSPLEPLKKQRFKNGPLPPLVVVDQSKPHSDVVEPRHIWVKGDTPDDEQASLVELAVTKKGKHAVKNFLKAIQKMTGSALEYKDAIEDATFMDFEGQLTEHAGSLEEFILNATSFISCEQYAEFYVQYCGRAQYTTACPTDSRAKNLLSRRMQQVMGYTERQTTTPQFIRLADGDFAADETKAPAGRPYAVGAYVFMDDFRSNGGNIVFPHIGVKVAPKRGRSVFFYPGHPTTHLLDKRLGHYIEPVHDGDLWILRMYSTKSLRDRVINAEHNQCIDRNTVPLLLDAGKDRLKKGREAAQKELDNGGDGSRLAELANMTAADYLSLVPIYQRLLNEKRLIESGLSVDTVIPKSQPVQAEPVSGSEGIKVESQSAERVTAVQADGVIKDHLR